jgi:hypothetical protein
MSAFDQAHRPCRIGLCPWNPQNPGRGTGTCCYTEKFSARKFHRLPLKSQNVWMVTLAARKRLPTEAPLFGALDCRGCKFIRKRHDCFFSFSFQLCDWAVGRHEKAKALLGVVIPDDCDE